MSSFSLVVYFRFALATALCIPAVLLPYRLRVFYLHALAFFVHLPLSLFGVLATYILERLEERPENESK